MRIDKIELSGSLLISSSLSRSPLRINDNYLYINPQGNIGIGTTNPTSKLVVTGSIAVQGQLRATTLSGSFTGSIKLPTIPLGTSETNIVLVDGSGGLVYRSNLSLTGAQGNQGTQGIQGIQGTVGTQGFQGFQGDTGAQGTQGTQGIQGTAGTQGIQGTVGAQGSQGAQGIQGTVGTQGATGASAGITSYTNPADNRVLTSVNSTTINAESNLTFDGSSLGIGTASPTSILDASLSSGAMSGFRFKGWSDASTPYLISLGTQTYQDIFQIKSVNGLVTMGVVGAIGDAPDLVLQTNTTERMRITSSGNVGIGTTSPTNGKLVVKSGESNSTGIVLERGSNTQKLVNIYSETADGKIAIASGANTNIFLNSVGDSYFTGGYNFGIGTTSPSVPFHVNAGANLAKVRVSRTSTSIFGEIQQFSDGAANGLSIQVNDGDAFNPVIVFRTATNGSTFSERMRITSDGNVGIGTTSPTFKLDVNGTGRFSSNFYVSGGTNTNIGNGIHAYYESNYAQIQLNGATGSIIDFSTSGTDYLARILYTNSTNLLEFKNNAGTTNFALANSGAATFSSSVNIGSWISTPNNYGLTATNAAGTAGRVLIKLNTSNQIEIGRDSDISQIRMGTASANDALTITSSGAVLIGSTQNDYGKLDVTVSPSSYTAALGLGLQTNSGEGNSVGISFKTKISLSANIWENARIAAFTDFISSSAYGALAFYTMSATNLLERMRIGNNGFVGIGTASPSARLSVVQDITTTAEFGSFGQFTLQGATNSNKLLSFGFNTATDAGFIQAMVNGTSYNNLLLNARGGNVGIGTTTPGATYNELLQVSKADLGRINVTHTNTTSTRQSDILFTEGTSLQFQVGTIFGSGTFSDQVWLRGVSNAPMVLYTNDTERMRITSAGNVGIGRTPTTNILEINGNASKTTAGDWLANSDSTIKTEIHTIDGALDRINKVRLVSFKYKDEYKLLNPSIKDKFYQNVIAQEYQEIYPDYVYQSGDIFEDKNILQVDTNPMYIDAVASIQQLSAQIDILKQEIINLKTN